MRIIIECPERILHLEAEYIYADCHFVNFWPLAVRRRTIHFRQMTSRFRIADNSKSLYEGIFRTVMQEFEIIVRVNGPSRLRSGSKQHSSVR